MIYLYNELIKICRNSSWVLLCININNLLPVPPVNFHCKPQKTQSTFQPLISSLGTTEWTQGRSPWACPTASCWRTSTWRATAWLTSPKGSSLPWSTWRTSRSAGWRLFSTGTLTWHLMVAQVPGWLAILRFWIHNITLHSLCSEDPSKIQQCLFHERFFQLNY